MNAENNKHESSNCPKCGELFTCTTTMKCWCFEINISSELREKIANEFEGCLCKKCITEIIEHENP